MKLTKEQVTITKPLKRKLRDRWMQRRCSGGCTHVLMFERTVARAVKRMCAWCEKITEWIRVNENGNGNGH